jgi:serine/threonine-protein kinase
MGRTAEALAEGRMAVELDPSSVSIRRGIGWLHYYARQPELAVERLTQALAMNPTSNESHVIMGLALTMAGRYAEAEAALRESLTLVGGDTHAMAALGQVAVLAGRPDDARRILAEFHRMSGERYVSPTDISKLLLALGDYEEAFTYAERSMAERRGWLVYMRVEPLFDPVRDHPRYLALARRMQLL